MPICGIILKTCINPAAAAFIGSASDAPNASFKRPSIWKSFSSLSDIFFWKVSSNPLSASDRLDGLSTGENALKGSLPPVKPPRANF